MEILFIFIIGLCVGSLINVLADRLPSGENVFWSRSHCDYCKKTLRWFELVPVVSFIIQRGRCMRCHKSLSIQYPIVELLTAFGFIYFYPSILLAIIYSCLLVIFISDFKYQIIPDSMLVIAGIAGFSVGNLIPALLSCLFFYVLWLITRGRGMGFGDVKLAFVMGLFLGYPGVIVALYFAFLTGAVVGVILVLGKFLRLKSHIAFGPFLIVGTWFAYLFTDKVILIWKSLI